jgi:hypothetical protein
VSVSITTAEKESLWYLITGESTSKLLLADPKRSNILNGCTIHNTMSKSIKSSQTWISVTMLIRLSISHQPQKDAFLLWRIKKYQVFLELFVQHYKAILKVCRCTSKTRSNSKRTLVNVHRQITELSTKDKTQSETHGVVPIRRTRARTGVGAMIWIRRSRGSMAAGSPVSTPVPLHVLENSRAPC